MATRYQRDTVARLRAPVDLNVLIALADAVRLGDADGSTLTSSDLDVMVDIVASSTKEDRATLRVQHPVYIAARFSVAARQTSSAARRADAIVEEDETRERRLMIERAGGQRRRSDARVDNRDAEQVEREAMVNRTRRRSR